MKHFLKIILGSWFVFSLLWLDYQPSSIKTIKIVIYQLRCLKWNSKGPKLAFFLPMGTSFHTLTVGNRTHSILAGVLTDHNKDNSFYLWSCIHVTSLFFSTSFFSFDILLILPFFLFFSSKSTDYLFFFISRHINHFFFFLSITLRPIMQDYTF